MKEKIIRVPISISKNRKAHISVTDTDAIITPIEYISKSADEDERIMLSLYCFDEKICAALLKKIPNSLDYSLYKNFNTI